MPTVTTKIEAYAAKAAKAKLEPFSFEAPPLNEWDIEVEITHCGICHSDLHLINQDWKSAEYPLVPGHEIIGFIKQKGKSVIEFKIGERVGIGWQRSSCQLCEWCHSAEENLCPEQEATCVGHPGGFADRIIADSRFAFSIPENLPSETAAPLLCGGITIFSPLLHHNVNATSKIGVIGIGGLGHLALQFANAFGCEVTAFSTSERKEKEAKELGAHHFFNLSNQDSLKKAKNSIDLLLYTASEEVDYSLFMSFLRPKGQLCILGAPKNGAIKVSHFDLISARKGVFGSNIGSPRLIKKMLQFASHHHIVAKTELFPFNEVNRAIDLLTKNQIHYRAVLVNKKGRWESPA